jgi:hypothetical protein
VTRHFGDLQGLRETVPLGIIFIMNGAGIFAGVVSFKIVYLVFAAALGALALASTGFYRRRFGEVERLDARERWEPTLAPHDLARSDAQKRWELALAPHGKRYFGGIEGPPYESRFFRVVEGQPSRSVARSKADRESLIAFLLGLSGCVAAQALAPRYPAQAVEVLCIVFGAALFWRWIRLEMMAAQLYYPVLGVLLLAAIAFHGATVALVPALGQFDGGMVLVEGAWLVAGLLDHWTLEKVLRPAGARRSLFARVREDAEETPWEEMQREETR